MEMQLLLSERKIFMEILHPREWVLRMKGHDCNAQILIGFSTSSNLFQTNKHSDFVFQY